MERTYIDTSRKKRGRGVPVSAGVEFWKVGTIADRCRYPSIVWGLIASINSEKVLLLLVANQKTIAFDGVCVSVGNIQNTSTPVINLVYTPIKSL